jgi:hypothetical protein
LDAQFHHILLAHMPKAYEDSFIAEMKEDREEAHEQQE